MSIIIPHNDHELEVEKLTRSLRNLKLYINRRGQCSTPRLAEVKVVYGCNGAMLPVFVNRAAGEV